MKLRRINARRYVDIDTGTYFYFASDTTEAEALEQAPMRLRQMLINVPESEVFGTDIFVPRMAKMKRPPKA